MVLDTAVQAVGIRTLTLDQSPDQEEPGTRFFRFVLNGVPVFARGADWIPADSFVGASHTRSLRPAAEPWRATRTARCSAYLGRRHLRA